MSDITRQLLVQNCQMANRKKGDLLDIIVENGQIEALCQPGTAPRNNFQKCLDAQGQLTTPGGVDIHSHLQYHVAGCDTADDFASGTLAAAFGGTTTVMDFVEAKEDEELGQAWERRAQQAAPKAYIDYSLHMSILPHDLQKLPQIPELVKAGCPTFKHYMAYAFALQDGQLYNSFKAIAKAGGLAIVHAENWSVIQQLIAESLQNGQTNSINHLRCRPASLEAQAIRGCLNLAELTKTALFIFHVTCHQGALAIAQAKAKGQKVNGETCNHYLRLNDKIFDELGNLPICSPPIRQEEERIALGQDLVNNLLQSVSSDHCPFTRAEKNASHIFNKVPGGMSSIETRFMLVKDLPNMTPQRWVEVCATNPAKIAGLNKKGSLDIGKDADIVIWNSQPWTITKDGLHEKADWTPYQGIQVSAKPQTVISRGQIIIENNQLKAQPGRGQNLPRFF